MYALHNSEPPSPLVKLVNTHKAAIISLSGIFRKVPSPPRSTSESVSQEGIPRKTLTGEPRKNPNKNASQSNPFTNV